MTAKTLMVVGSMSSAGKSLLVTALCRIFARRGVRVAPFKAQNMSNNAAVCPDGGEIGRAQALQAAAAGLIPTVDMNPVLIKPEGDSRSQVILMGHPWCTLQAKTYYEKKESLWTYITASLDRLCAAYDLVILEGAGSPAELNLKRNDIVNLSVAQYIHAPVLLVGDIDRGGIFAQLLGTLWLLDPAERSLIHGFIVNKFRGDRTLFDEGVNILERKGEIPVLGVIPYLRQLNLPDEDAVSVERFASRVRPKAQIQIAALAFPCIANFDDFDPLKAEKGLDFYYIHSLEDWGAPDAILLPGTKSTMADLEWMRQTGLAEAVTQFAQSGGAVAGICGGYQMLGERIEDPLHVESGVAGLDGLGLLPISTRFSTEKATFQVQAHIQKGPGWFGAVRNMPLNGYEIHTGDTLSGTPWVLIDRRNAKPVHVPDGCVSADGKVWGCYLHGLFANDDFRHAWLRSLGWRSEDVISQADSFQQSLEVLANTVESAMNMDLLNQIIWNPQQ